MSQTNVMARLLFCGFFLGLISTSLPGATQAAQPKSKQVLKHLPFERLKAVEYVARVSHSMPPLPQNPLTHGETFRVQARRPNLLRIQDIKPDKGTIIKRGVVEYNFYTSFPNLVSDGKTLLLISRPKSAEYKTSPSPAELQEIDIDEDRGLRDSVGYWVGLDLLFAPNSLKMFVAVPKDSGGQSLGQVYRHEIVIGDQAVRWELTLDKKTSLPIRLSTFIRMKEDPWHEMLRTDFSKWNLHPAFTKETFRATVPKGYQLKK